MRPEPPSPFHRSFARWLVGTEPVALVLLLSLAVLLLAVTLIGLGHQRPAAETGGSTAVPTTAGG